MSKKGIINYVVVPSQSMAAIYRSIPTVINYLDNLSYQVKITTTNSTGVFTVEVSDDYKRSEPSDTVQNAGNWVTLPLSANPVAAAANDDIVIALTQIPFSAVRLVYTPTIAGTGTMSVRVTGKVLGA